MKKTIMSVITLILLCTMCMGLIACDIVKPIDVFQFAKESTFSFGEFEEIMLIGLSERAKNYSASEGTEATASNSTGDDLDGKNGGGPALSMKNDLYFEGTIDGLQSLYDAYLDEYLESKDLTEETEVMLRTQKLRDCIECQKVAFRSLSYTSREDFLGTMLETDVGDYLSHDPTTILLDQKEQGDYVVASILEFQNNKVIDSKFWQCVIFFETWVMNKAGTYYITMTGKVELFWYLPEDDGTAETLVEITEIQSLARNSTNLIETILDNASRDELYKLSKGYFDVMEEVIFAWLNDPRGQAYINKYYS